MTQEQFILLATFFISLFLGSFYNVVGLRVLKNESISFPPSHCTSCNHRLGVLDLFPVFSWLLLGGKCRYCKEPISKIYPFGELLTAISYTVVVHTYGLTLEALVNIVLVTVLAMATVSDLKEMEVPDRFVVIGLIIAIPLRIILSDNIQTFGNYVIGGFVSFGVLFAVLLFGGMGGADVKLYALIGFIIGLPNSGISLFYASLVATVYHIPQLINKKAKRKTALPFVPFIAIGVLLTYIIPVTKLMEILY